MEAEMGTPITIGDYEALAGVNNRDAFWKSLIPIFVHQGTTAGMAAFRKKINKSIRARNRQAAP